MKGEQKKSVQSPLGKPEAPIKAYLGKNPNAELKEENEWALRDNQFPQEVKDNREILNTFMSY